MGSGGAQAVEPIQVDIFPSGALKAVFGPTGSLYGVNNVRCYQATVVV